VTASPAISTFLRPPNPDPELAERFEKLRKRVQDLLLRALEKRRPSFDIPSSLELQAMPLRELFEIADAVGAQPPFLTRVFLSAYTVVAATASNWQKINERKRLDAVEAELSEYESENC
jgi:hypothetical protein